MPLLCLLAATTIACGGDPGSNDAADTSGSSDTLDDAGALPDTAADPDADAAASPDGQDASDSDTNDVATDADGPTDTEAPSDADVQGGSDSDAAPGPDADLDSNADTASDADLDTTDTRVFVPGTLPLTDYAGCDENSDCPNGTGNCITALTLNRADDTGRLRIPVGEVFPDLTRSGVCSLDCANSEAACSTLSLSVDSTRWHCQLVYADNSAYPVDDTGARPPFPFDDQIDPGEMTAGPAFGALCRPPFERSASYAPDFCVECSAALNCHPGSGCVVVSPWAAELADAGTCLSPCAPGGACPSGFECRSPDAARDGLIAGEDTQEYCFPAFGSCSACTDADADGFGVGRCATSGGASAVDCDDLDPAGPMAGRDVDPPVPRRLRARRRCQLQWHRRPHRTGWHGRIRRLPLRRVRRCV